MQRLVRWLKTPPPALASGLVVAGVGLLGTVIYARAVDPTYALKDWLAWPLLELWGWVLLLNLAFVSLGYLLLSHAFRERELPLLETLVMSTAVGVGTFTLLMYLAGALKLYGSVFAPCLALGLVAAGAPGLWHLWRRSRDERTEGMSLTPWGVVALLLGGACVGWLYLGVLTPDAVNYDASWSHLNIAQDYAREGGIVAFPADYYRGLPHLASLVHTWSFSVPGLTPQLHWMLALHQEFALFLWTLAGMAAACRWMCDDGRLAGSWAGFFLFPIIYVYDHNLGGAADHVAAFFALPILLATGRLWQRFEPRRAALLGCLLGALLLTKYQAVYLMAGVGFLFGPRFVLRAIAALRAAGGVDRQQLRQLAQIAAALVLGTALVSAPHFAKNVIFYHNPVYPFMQRVFASQPTVPDAAFLFENIFTDVNWVPQGNLLQRIKHALVLSQTFSFEPHYSFTKNFPVFGSLFTLLFPILPFVRHRGRIALGAALGLLGLLMWSYTFNVDRNLQVLMPVLAAATVALIVSAYRTSRLALIGLVPVVGMQIIWGADALFYSSHDRVRSAVDLIRSGYEGHAKRRFDHYRAGFLAVSKVLPRDATVLLHASHVSLGINRRMYLDWSGFQGLITYQGLRTPRELHAYYRKLGITHVIYQPGERPGSTLQEEVLFDSLVHHYASKAVTAGGYRVVDLRHAPPQPEAPYRVALQGVTGYDSGLYGIEQLTTNEYLLKVPLRVYPKPQAPLPAAAEEEQAPEADAVVVGVRSTLPKQLRKAVDRSYVSVMTVPGHFTVYRKRPSP